MLSVTGTTSKWKINGTGGVMRAALWVRTAARLPPLYVECKPCDAEVFVQILTSNYPPRRLYLHPLRWFSYLSTPIPGILLHPQQQRGTDLPERVYRQRKQRHNSPLIHGVNCATTYLEITYVYTRCWRRNPRLRYCLASTPLQRQTV